jgi:hypothetical protein
MVRDSDRAVAIRSGAEGLRSMAAAERDRELAWLMLTVAEDMERYAAEIQESSRGWGRSRASATE